MILDIKQHIVEHEILRQNTWLKNGNNVYYNKGNVGIGTDSPDVKLSVVGGATGNVAKFYAADDQTRATIYVNDAASYSAIYSYDEGGTPAYNKLWVGHPTVPRLVVDGGNVGIGTASPDKLLEVASDSTPTIRINNELIGSAPIFDDITLGAIEFFTEDTSASGKHVGAYINAYSDVLADTTPRFNLVFGTSVAGVAAPTEQMRITAEGNVGIGTDSPSYALEVSTSANGIAITDSGDSDNLRVVLGDSSGNGGYLTAYDDSETQTALIRSYAVSNVQAYFTAGNVGIGTTSPSSPLTIKTSDNEPFEIQNLSGDQKIYFSLISDEGDLYMADSLGTFTVGIRSAGDSWLNPAVGNVGIGTTSPERKLHVSGGGFKVDSDSTPNLLFASGTNIGIGTGSPTEKFEVGGGNVCISGTVQTNSYRINGASGITGDYVAGGSTFVISGGIIVGLTHA